MIENARLSGLMGGFYHCTPKWNWDRDTGRSYFKKSFAFWLPVRGGASIETTAGKCRINPRNLYFIPNHHLLRQTCECEMDVFWVAFDPESFYMRHRLMQIRSVHVWPLASVPWVRRVFETFTMFLEKKLEKEGVRENPPVDMGAKMEGTLMFLVGDLIESTKGDDQPDHFSELQRLKPAIDYMDEHYLRNPSVSEIAQEVTFSADYFHRFFKKATGITPSKYMENRRLDLARKLLFDGRLNITEVAEKSGYNSIYSFSNVFRRRFGISPSRLRRVP